MRGKGVANLPATIRTVTQSIMEGDAMGFWQAAGLVPAYGLVKTGSRFSIDVNGHNVEVIQARTAPTV